MIQIRYSKGFCGISNERTNGIKHDRVMSLLNKYISGVAGDLTSQKQNAATRNHLIATFR